MSSIRALPLRPLHVSPDRASISVWMKLGRSTLMVAQVLIHLAVTFVRQARPTL